MSLVARMSRSSILKGALTLLVYAFYACVLGMSLAPSLGLLLWALQRLLAPAIAAGGFPAIGSLLVFSLYLGASAYLFFFFGLLLMGCFIRLFSLGIKPGRHEEASPTVLLWIVLSGVWTLAVRLILPLVPMTPVSMMFHRLSGCRIGKNVWINTINLVDCYMTSIGDNTVIGGDAIICPHVFEQGHLIIRRITIGRNCLIGSHAYLSPGVTLGVGSIVGMKAYVRKGVQIPPGMRVAAVAGLPYGRAFALEKGAFKRIRPSMRY